MSKVLVNETSLENIGDAIRKKTGSTDTFKPSEMGAAIEAIAGGGGVELPELTNPAAAGDIPDGMEAIDGSGNKIIGELFTVSGTQSLTMRSEKVTKQGEDLQVMSEPMDGDTLIRDGGRIGVRATLSEFGDATAADVLAGKTFTSAAGVAVVGEGSVGSPYAMFIITGMSEADTVTATFGEKTLPAIWNSEKNQHEITDVKDFGMWEITASNGENVDTQSVLVDAFLGYKLEMSYKLWLYRNGDECEDDTGGLGFVAGSTGKATLTKNADNMVLHVNDANYLGCMYTKKKIDLTNYKKLYTVGNFAFGANGSPWYYVKNTGVIPTSGAISDGGDRVPIIEPSLIAGIHVTLQNKTVDTIVHDVSNISGEHYLKFIGHCGVMDLTFEKIWLE